MFSDSRTPAAEANPESESNSGTILYIAVQYSSF